MISQLWYVSAIVLPVIFSTLGISFGQSRAAQAGLKAMDEQPSIRNEIFRALVLGLALMETAGVMCISLAVIMLLDQQLANAQQYTHLALLGIPAALISGLVLGYVSSWATAQACLAIARQPFSSQKIINLLLITQSLLQTPIIFGFFVAWFIKMQALQATTLLEGARLLASGAVIGFGSIGPIIGLALFAQSVIRGVGIGPKAYPQLMTFTFFSEAIIETPIIFAFIISLLMLFLPTAPTDGTLRLVVFIAATFATAVGVFMPGVSSGRIASEACTQIAQKPELYPIISRTSMLAQALVDTFVIYTSLISFILLLVVK